MGQTHKMEVIAVDGDTLKARVSLVSVDEIYLWISKAFFACQLHESTWDKSDGKATRDALKEADLYTDQDAEDDDDGLASLDRKADAFIRSVEIGAVEGGRVTGKNRGALRVERTDRAKAPSVEVTLEAVNASTFRHLKPGAYWETAPMGFGAFPQED